jgi:hypothetical protein
MLIPQFSLFFFLVVEMDVPSAFDRAIRYSVSQYQRSTFDHVVARLVTNFLSYLATVEVFRSKAGLLGSVIRLCA